MAFFQWFVTEQVEEESCVGEILDKLILVGTNSGALYHLDMELVKRGDVSTTEE